LQFLELAKKVKPKVWISMGLCFSHNTEKHGKRLYPYAEITPLAILLWRYFFPNVDDVGVILYLIYTEPRILPHMEAYEKSLRTTGVNLVKFSTIVTYNGVNLVKFSTFVTYNVFSRDFSPCPFKKGVRDPEEALELC